MLVNIAEYLQKEAEGKKVFPTLVSPINAGNSKPSENEFDNLGKIIEESPLGFPRTYTNS